MLVTLNSARVPVIFNDRPAAPVVLDFMDPPPAADLSISLNLAVPLVTNKDTVDVVATVQNNGPADAEGIWGVRGHRRLCSTANRLFSWRHCDLY